MGDRALQAVTECLEAHAYYSGARKYKDSVTLTVICEAYLMRSETLTKLDTEK